MTPEEKRILRREIPKYIKENCYYTDGTIKYYDLWLVGWVAEEFNNPKNAMRVLISNKYGLLGNLLYKQARAPDISITRLIEQVDLDILLKAISAAGDSVLWRNELDTDPYAMGLLVNHDTKYGQYAKGCSKAFLLSVAPHCPELLKNGSTRTFDDRDFVRSLIEKNYACLKHIPYKVINDYQLCLEAASREGLSLMYLDPAMRDHDEIVLAAVSNRGSALSFASPRQKKNRDIVRAAVTNCGMALDYADASLKGDFEIVALAVANRGMALRYASPELRDCEEIVRIAVENDGYAICSASERLRDNTELAMLAIASYPEAYNYLSPRLRNDPEITRLYTLNKEESSWHPSGTR